LKVKILHKTPKGFLIGRGQREIKIGSEVIFNNKVIGKVVDIFGPVAKPYIKILPISKDIDISGTAYIKDSKTRHNKKRKN
jgi:RNA-binding protein